MGIAITLQEYLIDHQSKYEVIEHTRTSSALETSAVAHVPGDQLVKSILLGDEDRYLLAVIPATHRLEINKLSDVVKHKLQLISESEMAGAFSDCEVGAMPPIGEAYGIDTWVDPVIFTQPEVYFESGDHHSLIRMSGEDFRELLKDTRQLPISHHL
ncbi:aminoacyl-tRNA deacylase [Sedimenticola selenatireducens]|uniref:YbaK/EbsC family protein n=1 Tax=Sedimenticola selenatireducens TaxID=191960 RepID=A0A557SFZ9_9GAMM|nr:YbaK/EbsC family protein [Sedimenticola selenatireducens]TVO76338.1 YbaK/EbsC family protein [Sedimenticola selenatireducens]TVT61448.1 MAG: YbaK/EbsC family protein [Sedimenticola selenatireducens]